MGSRIVQVDQPGGFEVLTIRDADAPQPSDGQVLVRTIASTINPVDRNMRTNKTLNPLTYPLTPGWDVAGVVADSSVGAYQAGDRVIAMTNPMQSGVGAWADLVAIDADKLAHAPASASLSEAATLPLAGLAALHAWNHLTLSPGDRMLVTGAAGAIGGLVVQLAANAGIHVDGLVSRTSHVDHVKTLGARFVATDPAALPAKVYNAIVDTIGLPKIGVDATELVTEKGQYVGVHKTYTGIPGELWVRVTYDSEGLEHLVRLVDQGRLRLRIAAQYSLEDIQRACEHFESGGLIGKVVLSF